MPLIVLNKIPQQSMDIPKLDDMREIEGIHLLKEDQQGNTTIIMVIKHRNKFYLVETNEQARGFKLL